MKYLSKILALSIMLSMVLFALSSCGGDKTPQKTNNAVVADGLIAAIGTVDKDSEKLIAAAEKAVSALSEEEKGTLENLEILEKARAAFKEKQKKIQAVEDAIKAIGTVDLESEAFITAARKAYDDLEQDLKSQVSNLSILEEAEAAYAKAYEEANPETYLILDGEEEKREIWYLSHLLNDGNAFKWEEWSKGNKKVEIVGVLSKLGGRTIFENEGITVDAYISLGENSKQEYGAFTVEMPRDEIISWEIGDKIRVVGTVFIPKTLLHTTSNSFFVMPESVENLSR